MLRKYISAKDTAHRAAIIAMFSRFPAAIFSSAQAKRLYTRSMSLFHFSEKQPQIESRFFSLIIFPPFGRLSHYLFNNIKYHINYGLVDNVYYQRMASEERQKL